MRITEIILTRMVSILNYDWCEVNSILESFLGETFKLKKRPSGRNSDGGTIGCNGSLTGDTVDMVLSKITSIINFCDDEEVRTDLTELWDYWIIICFIVFKI